MNRFATRAAALLGAVLAAAAAPPAAGQADPRIVQSAAGTFVGVAGPVRHFFGIPFARPPVGDLRWRPPQPLAPFQGRVDATRFGADCMQKPDPRSRGRGVGEDCLTLNIWTPAAGAAGRRPVLVWIYGGGFTGGSGALPIYDGERLARRGVIVVTLNYRVGVFGFLAHPGLTRESDHHASGNYGLMDQLAALGWVKRNIAAFGGDPGNVTVFGQSAGASSLSHLIVSHAAAGLFQRAILESPGAMRPLSSLGEAEKTGGALGADIGRLRALPAAEVLAFNDRIVPAVRKLTAPRALGPIADGWIVRSQEGPAYAAGDVNRVPLLIGGNADEGRLFVTGWPITATDAYEGYVSDNFGADAASALTFYPASNDARVKPALADLFSDTQYHYGIRAVARGMARLGQKVFRYRFSHVAAGTDVPPTHGQEVPFVFGSLDELTAPATADDNAVSNAMMDAWVRFATSGDPNAPGLPIWPDATEGKDFYADLRSGTPTIRRDYRSAQLDFLTRFFSRKNR